MKKSLPLAALLGATGLVGLLPDADAATLVSVKSWNSSGFTVWNLSLDTSTWTFDLLTGTAVQTGGTYSALAKAGLTPLMRHTMTGVTLGSGAATGATWACIEGNFGPAIAASVCGNYNFGVNTLNESVYTPTATGATVTIGGDDGAIGPPQSLVNSYSGMVTTAIGGAPVGFDRFCLSNANVSCGSVSNTSGYDFVFQQEFIPVPAAVWLFGSALGLMGVMRRKTAV